MINDETSEGGEGRFDLEERTALFGEAAIRFARTLKLDAVSRPLVTQLVRSATSVGANYCEANDAVSKKGFRYKISLCRKESKESKFWLRMMAPSFPASKDVARELWQEAKELNLIFAAIRRSAPES